MGTIVIITLKNIKVVNLSFLLIGILGLSVGCSRNDTETYSHRVLVEMSKKHSGNPKYSFLLGKLYLKEGKLDKARQQFEKALRIDQNFQNAQAGLGYIALKNGQYVRAKFIFDRVLQKDPGNHMAIKGLKRIAFETHQTS